MAHAVIKTGGKQFLVEEGQTLRVPSLAADAGSSVELEALLTTATEASKISATVVDHGRDQKIVVLRKSVVSSTSVHAVTVRDTRHSRLIQLANDQQLIINVLEFSYGT